MKIFKALHDKKDSFFAHAVRRREGRSPRRQSWRGKFSALKKKHVRGMGEVSNVVGVKLFETARSPLARLKDIALVDAQRSAVNFLLGLSPRKFRLVPRAL
jgi:hypothetical protein